MVTRSDLYPTDHGAAVRIVETARGLSLNGHEVGIVSDRRDVWWHYRNGELHDRRFPRWLGLMGLPPGIGSLFRTNGNFPRSNAFLYLPLRDIGFTWRALYVARFLNANVYQAEFPAFVQPCLRLRSVRGGRVIAVEHNVEYERLRDQDPDLTEEQYLFIKDVEVGLCNLADAVVCVSDDDRRRLSGDGVNERLLRIIPHGVDLEGFRRDTPRDIRRELDLGETGRILAYHGTFEYPPNLEAVKVCAREVLPRLADRGLDVHLVAIGKHAPPEPIHPRVHFVGSVGRVAQWLKGAEVAVVPLMSGGGTRMKIIDYFASGVPVVSTSKGIEGIPAFRWSPGAKRSSKTIGMPSAIVSRNCSPMRRAGCGWSWRPKSLSVRWIGPGLPNATCHCSRNCETRPGDPGAADHPENTMSVRFGRSLMSRRR